MNLPWIVMLLSVAWTEAEDGYRTVQIEVAKWPANKSDCLFPSTKAKGRLIYIICAGGGGDFTTRLFNLYWLSLSSLWMIW